MKNREGLFEGEHPRGPARIALLGPALSELGQLVEVGGRLRSGDLTEAIAASRLSLLLSKARAELVDAEPGYVVIDGLNLIDKTHWHSAFRILSICFGDIYPQDARGVEVREVRDRGTSIGEGESSRYSDSRCGGSLHTDGAQVAMPVPDYFSLLCVRPAAKGGAFIMVDARQVYTRLRQTGPEILGVLQEPFHFDSREVLPGGMERTVLKPVFFQENEHVCATYLREYIDAGHRHEGVPVLSDGQRSALDALDQSLSDLSLREEFYMREGELIVVNNKRFFHGRTAFEDFEDEGRKRLLLRAWLRRRPAPSQAGA